MSECPSPDDLLALLADDADCTVDASLISHVGHCERCQRFLADPPADSIDDWQNLESLIAGGDLTWPEDKRSRTQNQNQSATIIPEDKVAGLASTVNQADERQPRSGPRPEPRVTGKISRRQFADYELTKKIGAGGMGVVYLARQISANRTVALKIIRPEQLQTLPEDRRQTWLDRFRAEAQAAARLEHDHVVRVYDVGEHQDGTLYYSMQYIDGESLADLVREDPIENRRLAKLMHGVALGVEHAHQHGVLHRDLKPHNILVQPARAVQSSSTGSALGSDPMTNDRLIDERSYVADFGLAKNLEDGRSGSTYTGEVMGSPSYMSPEQALDASRCTVVSDVYGIGATMYDALTGRPPFRAASPVETLRQVIDQPPVEPRELNPAIDLDLQTITLKALEKDPVRRYPSAQQLADDLWRYINGMPIEARPIGIGERTVRWARRNPMVATLLGSVAALLLLVAIGSVIASRRLSHQAVRESIARKEAEDYFVMSLDVIQDMLTDYGDESLRYVPQMEQARKELLQKALDLYSDLLKTKPSNPDLRIEFARTQYRIGVLYDLLGDAQSATNAYAESVKLFEALLGESPRDPELRMDWAKCHAKWAETLRRTSPAEAEVHFNEAIVSQSELLQSDRSDPRYRRELSETLNNHGLLLTETGEYEFAEQRLGDAIDHLQELASRKGVKPKDHARLLADLGRSQLNLGVLLRKMEDQTDRAERAYRQAIDCLQQAVETDSKNRDTRFRLAIAMVDLANVQMTRGSDGAAKALQLAERAANRLDRLSRDFPRIPVHRYEQANACNTAAVAAATLGNLQQSAGLFADADRALNRLENSLPEFAESDARFHGLRGRIRGGQGFLHSLQGDTQRALELVQQAIESQQMALKLHPENPEFAGYLDQHLQFQDSLQPMDVE